MRYISFRRPDGTASFGRLDGESVTELATAAVPDLKSALAQGALASLAGGARFALAEVALLPVIPNPGKIFCVGLNYATHVAETGREQKEHPAIFQRWSDTLVAHGQPISDLLWDIPAIIAYCSTFTTLAPGDVIATGTPGGVGDKRQPPLYMQAGDTVEVSIGAIGTLRNRIIDEI